MLATTFLLLPLLAQIEVGSVGVAYAGKQKDELRVVFPARKGPIEGDLVLFGETGQLGRVAAGKRVKATKCGAELTVKLALESAPTPKPELPNLIAFVAVVPRDAKAKFELEGVAWRATDEARVLDGDFDGDGKPEAVIYLGKTPNLLAGDRWDPLCP